MNKNFIIVDRVNNVQKNATSIIKFTLDSKDYLIYCVDENEENRQIFVSRLILNSEGKYFIDNIVQEEKARLSEIVYNIIILTPTNFKKGENADVLLKTLAEKFKIELSNEIPELNEQEYYNNCSIAITSKELVLLAIEFLSTKLVKKEQLQPAENVSSVPTWELPSDVQKTIVNNEIREPLPSVNPEIVNSNSIPAPNSTVVVEPIPNAPINSNLNNVIEPIPNSISSNLSNTVETLQPVQQPPQAVVTQTSTVSEPDNNINNNVNSIPANSNNFPNPQVAIMSDPSLASITGTQPNVAKLNNKGKASVKYIVIGTVCILLAIAVVVVAYILIQKKTTGV